VTGPGGRSAAAPFTFFGKIDLGKYRIYRKLNGAGGQDYVP